nr:pyrrolidone-carboxylate peptidase-like [Ipomoea batatas]
MSLLSSLLCLFLSFLFDSFINFLNRGGSNGAGAMPGGFGKRLITATSFAVAIDLSRRRISRFIIMGSEGPSPVAIHITGFKKFHGVAENPTEIIVSNLQDYMKKKGTPKGLILGSCSVLETAGQGALVPLYQTLQSALRNDESEPSHSRRVIWLHFGVNSGASKFAIERQAVNEATFRCADEMGWKPQKIPIVPMDGAISRIRETSFPVEEITKALAMMGYEVTTSNDAGRFVCNYVYYHSLRFAEQYGIKSLFVHVPLFSTIDEETQMQFAASLLEALASVS